MTNLIAKTPKPTSNKASSEAQALMTKVLAHVGQTDSDQHLMRVVKQRNKGVQ
jgi:hypothetical protein